jgi:lipid-A-disaccharide synthase
MVRVHARLKVTPGTRIQSPMEQTGPEHSSVSNPHSSALPIMIVAGEASGDRHGAALARALRQVHPHITYDLFGAGGEEMRSAGIETLVDARDVAIIGVPEITRALGKLYRAYRALLHAARSRRPAVVVLIDWPDFNMRLAKRLHRDGFKVVYYISPQVWAWRKYRVQALRRDVDRMLVILPFEEKFYKKEGLEVSYVGHPLAESVRISSSREEFCTRHQLDSLRPLIALLPGSRHKEIHYHLPPMLDAAIRLRSLRLTVELPSSKDDRLSRSLASRMDNHSAPLQSTVPQTALAPQFIVPLASTVRPEDVRGIIEEACHGSPGGDRGAELLLSISIIEGDTYNALGHSQFAVVASGTATLEAALLGTPMVVVYRGSEINWRLIRPLIHLDTFGMVNLIAGRRIVPELMQHEVTGEGIAREVTDILTDPTRLSRMQRDLAGVQERLATSEGSASERAAREVLSVIGVE